MLSVFAKSFMTATRINEPNLRDVPKPTRNKARWLPEHHWWKKHPHTVDLDEF